MYVNIYSSLDRLLVFGHRCAICVQILIIVNSSDR